MLIKYNLHQKLGFLICFILFSYSLLVFFLVIKVEYLSLELQNLIGELKEQEIIIDELSQIIKQVYETKIHLTNIVEKEKNNHANIYIPNLLFGILILCVRIALFNMNETCKYSNKIVDVRDYSTNLDMRFSVDISNNTITQILLKRANCDKSDPNNYIDIEVFLAEFAKDQEELNIAIINIINNVDKLGLPPIFT